MKSDFPEVMKVLNSIIPSYAEVSIDVFEQPLCSTAIYENPAPLYYQIYLSFPLKGKKIGRPNNVFSLSRRVESIDRTKAAWLMTITSMVNEETEQRRFINRRVQQARRQEWLYGGDVRIDGKPSTRDQVAPRLRGFIF